MKLKDFTEQLTKLSKFKNIFEDSNNLAYEVSQMLIQARIIKGLTQEELADKLNTKQSSIARAENGKVLPSLSFLDKMAKVYDSYLTAPRFAFLDDIYNNVNINAKLTENFDKKFSFNNDKPQYYLSSNNSDEVITNISFVSN